MRLRKTLILLPLLLGLVGCAECLDDYPHNDTPLQSTDVKKSGPGDYGGQNNQTRIILPNGDTSTKSSTTQVP